MRIQPKPIIHGRDHMPGGADPIPGLGTGTGSFSGTVIGIDDLLAYWRLGETGTPWADTSGVGTPSDMGEQGSGTALTPDVAGALLVGDDGAVEFNYDGVAQSGGRWMTATTKDFDLALISPRIVTVCAWVKTKTVASTRRGLIAGTCGFGANRLGYGIQIMYPGREIRFTYSGSPEVFAQSPSGIVVGDWVFAVGTYDGTTHKLYLDGVLVASQTGAASAMVDDTFRIGMGLGGGSSSTDCMFLYGTVDEVAVWKRDLTQAEITSLYESGVGGSAAGSQVLVSDGHGGVTFGQANGDAIEDEAIVNRHVATAADIVPTKLQHPGGTTSFLRADGTWAAPPGGGIATDAVWDAKGDLVAASAADTAARLPVGTNDQVLVADSGQTLGVKWASVPGVAGLIAVSTIDAKGDLLVGSANDAVDNLAVGTDTHVLTADSSQTLGVKWAAPSAGGGVAADAIWDAKGDIAAASGSDAADNLSVGSDGQVLTADAAQTLGVKWAAPGSGFDATVTKASDESVASSTVLQNDDELFFTATSGKLYFVEATLIYVSASATPDLKFGWGEDSGIRGVMSALLTNNSDTPSFPTANTNQSAGWIAGTATTLRACFCFGTHLGNGGTFRLVWAQSTSNVNATTVKAGSYLRYRIIV